MENPFDKIALALSGGGFRAAAFSLGALKLLHDAELLEKVHMLSTISGGTITGAYYAVNAKKKKPFTEIFKSLYDILEKDEIVNTALDVLENHEVNVPSKRQNLILSFAETYDRKLFNNEIFGIFWEEENDNYISEKDFHLKEIIFNATDFDSGIAFRFWKSMGSPRIGNKYNSIKKGQAKSIRMADILAASSCFPGGFEPICIPDDFKWNGENLCESAKKELKKINVPLMDGGVYDNQGIDSLLQANENNKKYLLTHPEKPEKTVNRQESTLFLMIDVAGAEKDFFHMPEPKQDTKATDTLENKYSIIKSKIKKFFRIKSIVVPFSLILMMATIGVLVLGFIRNSLPWPAVVLLILLVGIFCWVSFFLHKVFRGIDEIKDKYINLVQPEIQKAQEKFPEFFPEAVEAFGKLSINRIIEMFDVRAKSVFAMTSGIFMKRIRSQGYSGLFKDENFEKKRIASLINDLTKNDPPSTPDFLTSNHLREKALNAAKMPTTLWFKNNSDKLKDLVASGRFTLCYNLLIYIHRHYKKSNDVEIEKVKKKLETIWEKIEHEPYYDIDNI